MLVGPYHETVLSEQGNIDSVNHAEAVLARMAAKAWTAEELWGCPLYTTVEPCCMCAGTQNWAHIGRLVYGMDERRLLEFTGNHPENATLDLPCRAVFAAGQKDIRVWGPVPDVEADDVGGAQGAHGVLVAQGHGEVDVLGGRHPRLQHPHGLECDRHSEP